MLLGLNFSELATAKRSLRDRAFEKTTVSPSSQCLGTIQKKLLNILERRQVQPIEFQDTKPNYSVCQVVDREEREDLEEQTITKVVRQGFRVEDKVLRPIEVITSKKPES